MEAAVFLCEEKHVNQHLTWHFPLKLLGYWSSNYFQSVRGLNLYVAYF